MPTPIMGSEISFKDDKTTVIDGVGGSALRNALVQKQAEMIAELVQEGAIVRPSEISIDENGRVIIENEEWTKVLQQRVSNKAGGGKFFDTNCSCGRPK